MANMDACCDKILTREDFWNNDINPVEYENLEDFGTYMGHEIAQQIKFAGKSGNKLAMILPVGPMGMYK